MRVDWKAIAAGMVVGLILVFHAGCGSSNPAPPPPGGHRVDLTWKASTSTIAGYNIYRSSESGGPYTRLNAQSQAGLQFSDKTVNVGQTYYYVVTSVDANSTESNYSNEATATVSVP